MYTQKYPKDKRRDENKRVRKKEFNVSISPIRKYIQETEAKMTAFDINQIVEWTNDNVRRYKQMIAKNFEEPQIMFNMMMYDKQIQELQNNYKLIRKIRDNENLFNVMINKLKDF